MTRSAVNGSKENVLTFKRVTKRNLEEIYVKIPLCSDNIRNFKYIFNKVNVSSRQKCVKIIIYICLDAKIKSVGGAGGFLFLQQFAWRVAADKNVNAEFYESETRFSLC